MRSEVTRYFTATGVAVVVAPGVSLSLPSEVLKEYVSLLISYYLVFWVVYLAVFSWLTVRSLSGRQPEELAQYALAERETAKKPWVKGWGVKGAFTLSLFGSTVAMLAAIAMSQIPIFHEDWRWLLLAGAAVVGSWAYMVLVFGTEYLEFDYASRAAGKGPIFEFHYDEAPGLGDYVGLALMVSTMGADLPARAITRTAWQEIKRNTAIAFVFNTMIIAMVVSVLSSTLSA